MNAQLRTTIRRKIRRRWNFLWSKLPEWLNRPLTIAGWRVRRLWFRLWWIFERRRNLFVETFLLIFAVLCTVALLRKPGDFVCIRSWIHSMPSFLQSPILLLGKANASEASALWLAWCGMYATRRLAANQLAPKLLERFNSNQMYDSRGLAYQELRYWSAGDRKLLIEFECEHPYWIESSTASVNDDRAVGVSQILGFVAELQHCFLRGLIDRRTTKNLLRDRFSWFIWFLLQLAEEIKASHDGLISQGKLDNQARFRFPFVYAPHTLRWLSIQCEIETFGSDLCYGLKHGSPGQVSLKEPSMPQEIQGLDNLEDLSTYDLVLDSNIWFPGSVFERRSQRAEDRGWKFDNEGYGGFIRLRMKRDDGDWRSHFLLDIGSPRPMGFQRSINYLTYDEARIWYRRLRMQGAVPQIKNCIELTGRPV